MAFDAVRGSEHFDYQKFNKELNEIVLILEGLDIKGSEIKKCFKRNGGSGRTYPQ